tara:strand:- start:196 stop:648 length:453 start_codon:yes stop_codon:yes gene_type:complete
MNDLQKVVVLCFFGILILGGVLFVAPQFISFSMEEDAILYQPEQVDVPSVPSEPVSSPSSEGPKGLPVVGNGQVIESFKDCVDAGYAVGESDSTQCHANGMLFEQDVSTTSVTPPATDIVACTQEAKICPDGSAVGRTGPDCAFAACPGE